MRAGVGGDAGAAARSMGAEAFTSGDRIGFRESPSLRLAAHESAHVIQQREGLSLPQQVGTPGDQWEQHADRVADAVVRGDSAEPLLDEVAPGGSGETTPPVQRQITSLASRKSEPAPAREEGEEQPEPEPEPEPEVEPEPDAEAPKEGALETANAMESETKPPTPRKGPPPSGCEKASGREGTIHAPKYRGSKQARPDGVDEPEADRPSSKKKGDSSIEFEEWKDEPDVCPAEKEVNQRAETLPPQVKPGEGAEIERVGETEPKRDGSGEETGTTDDEGVVSAAANDAAQKEAIGAEFEARVGTAESERAQSIGNYEASVAGLEGVRTRAAQLEQGFGFEPGADEDAYAVERRDAAEGQVRDFMRRAGTQLIRAVDYVQHEVPGLLSESAESAKAAIEARMQAEKDAISARIAQTRSLAIAESIAAQAQLLSEHANAISMVNTETDAAIEALDEQYETSRDTVDETEDGGLDEVNRLFARGRKDHEARGPHWAAKAVQRGQDHADAYEDHKENEKGKDWEDDGFWDGCLWVRRAHAQQETACKTAKGYRDKFLLAANRKAFNLRDQRKSMRCAVIAGARRVRATLDQTHADLVNGLKTGREKTLDQLQQAFDKSSASISDGLDATIEALASQERAQRQAINDNGYLKQLAIERVAHTVAAGLAESIHSALVSVDGTLSDLRAQFESGEAPEADVLAERLAAADEGLSSGMGTLLGKMEEGAGDALMRIDGTRDAAFEALARIREGNDSQCVQVEAQFSTTMATIMAGATTSIGSARDTMVEQAQKGATSGVESMQKIVTGYQQAVEGIYGKIDEVLTESEAELDAELKKTHDQLDNVIPCEAWKAAEKEQPAWKSVVAILLIIAIIVIVAVVAGPAVLALAKSVGTFLASVIVGAISGAVSGGLMTLVNNWASGRAWDEGLVDAILMGAIGGALGGGLGFLGGAMSAGVGTVARIGINLGADLVADALTQVIGILGFGQSFSLESLLMAGVMSGVGSLSSGARPRAGGRTPSGGVDVPSGGARTPRAQSGASRGRNGGVEAPSAPRGRTTGPDTPGGLTPAQVARRTVVGGVLKDLGVGVGFGLGAELVGMLFGREFDATRMSTNLASVMSTRLGGRLGRTGTSDRPSTPPPKPRGRLGRTAARIRGLDQRLSQRLDGVGRRVEAGGKRLGDRLRTRPGAPDVDPNSPRRRATDEPEQVPPRRLDDPDPRVREPVPDTDNGVVARVPASDGHHVKVLDDGRIVRCSPTCTTLQMRYGPELESNPRLRQELEDIQRIPDPQRRAERAADLEIRLSLEMKRRPSAERGDNDPDGPQRHPPSGERRIDPERFQSLVDDFAANVTSSNFTVWKRRQLAAGYSPVTIQDVVHHGALKIGRNPWKDDWSRYLAETTGRPIPRGEMERPHAHHMAQKKGGGGPGRLNREILADVGIDPLLSRHNLEWAPNVKGQHGRGPQAELLRRLLPARGDRAKIIEVLNEWRAVTVQR